MTRCDTHRGRAAALLAATLLAGLATAPAAPAADNAEVAELRRMLEQMRQDYQRRIDDLEARLARAERQAAAAAPAPDPAASRPMTVAGRSPTTPPSGDVRGALSAGSAFNPQIAVILDGNFYQDDVGGEGATLAGSLFQPGRNQYHLHAHGEDGHDHAHGGGHSHGAAENGFNFREAEIAFSGTVDPYFDAALFLAVDGDGEVDLEEGWLRTRSLPWGLQAKAGKFLSDFGYSNRQHPHQWDFVDQNLPYLNLLGPHGLQDTGLQLTWRPPLPFHLLVGAEALQGDQEVFGATLSETEREALDLGDPNQGPRLWTGFLKVAPNLPEHHALQFGVSFAHNTTQQLVHEHVHAHRPGGADHDHTHEVHQVGMAGDASLWGLDLVYKYDGGGPEGQGDFKFQTEYLRASKDLTVRASAHPEQIGSARKFTTDGLYAQATYGFLPRWSAGLRYDVLGLTNEVTGGVNKDFGSSDRWTANVTWKLSEFSLLRAQYAWNDFLVAANDRERFDAFYLQFQVGLGTHGAHSF